MRPAVRPVVACALALLAAGPAAADPFRDQQWRFTLEVPAGWERMSADEVGTLNTVMRSLTRSEDATYEVGFRPTGSNPGDYPFVLIQKVPGEIERATYDEIHKGLTRSLRMPVQSVEGKAAEPTVGRAVLDRSRHRVAVTDTFKAPGVGPVRSLTIGHLGESGVVFVHCYAQEEEFAKTKPTFDQLNDSFRYDLGYEFLPAGAEPATAGAGTGEQPAAESAADGPGMEVSLAVGGVVALIVGVFMWVVFKVAGPTPARHGRRADAPVARRVRRRSSYDD
jgi:hypothetical protein